MLQFHKMLVQELKQYNKKKGKEFNVEFPPKKIFHNTDREFVHKRIKKLNAYFAKIFEEYRNKVPFTNAILDLCQP